MKKRLPRSSALLAVATLAASMLSSMNGARAASATATIAGPSQITGSPVVSFSSNVWQVSTSNVVLRLQDSTNNLPSSITCTNATGQSVDCGMGPVRAVSLKPASALTPGQRYRVIVNPSEGSPAPVSDYLLPTAIPAASRPFIASLFEEESSAAASYQWRTLMTSAAYEGSYQTDFLPSASLTFGFTGRNFTWYTVLGPTQGLASVSVDGVGVGTYNNYSSTTRYRYGRLFRGFNSGYHRVTIWVLGKRGSPSGSTWVSVDAFAANGVIVHPKLRFGWQPVSSAKASGGRYVRAGTRGATVRFVFRGRSIDWITLTGPTEGTATMYIDGIQKASVNNKTAAFRYGVVRRITNLSDAVHTLMIVSGTGGMTSVDRFIVRLPDLTIFRGLGTWVDLFDYGTSSGLDPTTAVPEMHSRGIRTIYIETARYNSSSAFDFPTDIGRWVEGAHAAGMKIVGWYLPTYGTYLNTDVSRTVAIAAYRSPAGQGFDGLGIDIEHKTSAQARSAWFTDIATHVARVRSGASAAFPIGAIIQAPLAMDIYPASWTGFPWAAIGANANIVLPMGYWSYRTDCSTDPSHCPYGYSVGNINEARSKTGGLPVHLIGGVADSVSLQGVKDFLKACHDAKAYGASLYDYRTTPSSFWSTLAGANTL